MRKPDQERVTGSVAWSNRCKPSSFEANYDRALEDFNEALQIDSNFAVAYISGGVAHLGKGEYNQAIDYFDKAIESSSDSATSAIAYLNRGSVYWRRNRDSLAIADLNLAIQFRPDHAAAYINLASVLADPNSEVRNYDQALSYLDQAFRLNPNSFWNYYVRGRVYLFTNEYGKAIENLNEAIKINSDYAGAYNDRGKAYWENGEIDLAIDDVSQAISLTSSNVAAVCAKRGFLLAEESKSAQGRLINLYKKRSGLYSEKNNPDRAQDDLSRSYNLMHWRRTPFEPCQISSLFPTGDIQETLRNDHRRVGNQFLQEYRFRSLYRGRDYEIYCTTPPEEFFGGKSRVEVMTELSLPGSRKIEIEGYPGSASVMKGPNGGFVFSRSYVIDNTVVVAEVFGKSGDSSTPPTDAGRFFDSFRVTTDESADIEK